MKMKSAIVLCFAIGVTMAVDYCGKMRCEKKPHIACNSPAANGGWGPECSPDRELVNITPELQQRILDIHNKLRNQQAAGKTPNYGPASRMGTLAWDDGLAEMAGYNARLCKYGHDKCRNTETRYPAGQNIAKGGGMTDDKEIIEKLTPAWFEMEAQNGGQYGWMKMINKFQGIGTSHDPKVEIGHFTQFIGQDASVVGCAGSKYTDSEGKQAILVCNYGFGNMPGVYLYEAGPTASKCKTGTNPDYPALCSVDEDYSEDVLKRSAWDLSAFWKPDGKLGYNAPNGCMDDPTGECQKMKNDPGTFFKSYFDAKAKSKPPAEVKIHYNPDGSAELEFPDGCDAECQQKAYNEFKKSHPEYGK